MNLAEIILYIRKNESVINISGLAKEIGMDASNFHKVMDGKIGLSDKRLKKLNSIVEKLCPKECD